MLIDSAALLAHGLVALALVAFLLWLGHSFGWVLFGISHRLARVLSENERLIAERMLVDAMASQMEARVAELESQVMRHEEVTQQEVECARQEAGDARAEAAEAMAEAAEAREQWSESQRELWDARQAICSLVKRIEALRGLKRAGDRLFDAVATAANAYRRTLMERN